MSSFYIGTEALKMKAIEKIIKMERQDVCDFLGLKKEETKIDIVQKYKEWIECKGYFHAAKELGLNSTRNLERWYRESKLPKCKASRILRIIKQEGMIL